LATAAIAKGTQITVGTNCRKTTVADAISDAVKTASWYKGILPTGTDLNDVVQESGSYCLGTSQYYTYTNSPLNGAMGMLEVTKISNITVRQTVEIMDGSRRYTRYYSSNVWNPATGWTQNY
jgi:hypothetical protein